MGDRAPTFRPWDAGAACGGRAPGVPRRGETLVHPTTGQSLTFLTTAGDVLELESRLPPGGVRPPLHVHPHQHERFTLVEGRAEARLGLRRLRLGPGDVLHVPPGTPHWFAGEGLLRWEFRPALRMADLLAAMGSVAERHGTLGRGIPHPPALARVLLEHGDELRLPAVPWSCSGPGSGC